MRPFPSAVVIEEQKLVKRYLTNIISIFTASADPAVTVRDCLNMIMWIVPHSLRAFQSISQLEDDEDLRRELNFWSEVRAFRQSVSDCFSANCSS